jgi:hypothetical protein
VNIPVTVAVLFSLAAPSLVAAQTPDTSKPLQRFSIQAAAGPLLKSGGHTVSAAVGFSPISRLDLIVNAERDQIPFQRRAYADSYGVTRGGTLTYVSGEVRASIMPPHRWSPYGFAGMGGGVSQPNVNREFPIAVENKLRMVYFGAGLRVPIGSGVSIFGDARAMLALEGDEGILGVWPVRAGVVWRF